MVREGFDAANQGACPSAHHPTHDLVLPFLLSGSCGPACLLLRAPSSRIAFLHMRSSRTEPASWRLKHVSPLAIPTLRTHIHRTISARACAADIGLHRGEGTQTKDNSKLANKRQHEDARDVLEGSGYGLRCHSPTSSRLGGRVDQCGMYTLYGWKGRWVGG